VGVVLRACYREACGRGGDILKGVGMVEQTMTALEQETRRLLELLDAMDVGGLAAMFTDDAQGVDEISGGWTRGSAALDAYLNQLQGAVSDVRSQISDLCCTQWGEVGLVTFVLDQTYNMHGQERRLAAPTSVLFRQQDGRWKVAMIHSVPIPDSADSAGV
jgi:ketosteroid isomerase-like protein